MNAIAVKLTNDLKRIDLAITIFVIAVLFLGFLDAGQLVPALVNMMVSLIDVLPWLLASILIAAYAIATGADNQIARAFSGNMAKMIITASLFGALSPFCSCGVIPIIAALLAMGVPLAPVMAFWLASPIMDPTMFALTTGTLGLNFAIAKTLAAIGIGLLGGTSIALFTARGWLVNPLRLATGTGCNSPDISKAEGPVWAFWYHRDRVERFSSTALSNGLMLGKWLCLAFFLEALMIAYIPDGMVRSIAGEGGVLAILGAALVGIPAYLNGYAALPLIGELIDQGMSEGPAMAFLIAGGVTSVPAAIAVFAVSRIPVFAAYVIFALIGSLTAGLLWQMVSALV